MAIDKAQLIRQMLEAFGRDMDFFYAHTHEEIELDFPFAGSNGFPEQVRGIDHVKPHFASVIAILTGWKAEDIEVTPFADPDLFLLRYRASCAGRLGQYDQRYISMARFQDDKLILLREYWDTLRFDRAWGDAKDAEQAALAAG